METAELSSKTASQPALMAHICTLTERQRRLGYEAALRASLRAHGFTVAAAATDQLPGKLEAAGKSHLCVLLLGPDLGPRDPLSSFSDTELEVSAARDHPQTQVLVFAEQAAGRSLIPEQQEFIDRMSHFMLGEFRTAPVSTPGELLSQLEQALAGWQPAQPQPVPAAPPVRSDSVLISSTSDDTMRARRALAGAVLRDRNLPFVDYLLEPSQHVPPIDLVTTWARECRLLLLILGQRYGYVSPVDGLGATELEFVSALGARRPILAFIGQDATETSDLDQRQFAERVQALLPGENVVQFTSSEEFSRLVHRQLARFEAGLVPVADGAPVISSQQAHRWYRRQTRRWLGVIPHLTQPQGMPLADTFVSLETLAQEEPGAADPRRVFSDDRGDQTHYSLRTIIPVDVDDALQRYSRLVLRGDPGAGKSMTLRWYAINAPDDITPIFVRLAGYSAALQRGEVASLLEYVHREEQRLVLSAPGEPSRWSQALRAGTARLLLDALDEVPLPLQQQIASEIDDLATELSGATRIVVTTRIAGFPAKLGDQFVVTQVQPLRRDQQRQLAEKWFLAARGGQPDGATLAQARTQRLMSWLGREPQVAEWARVPLLMTFLAALFDTPGEQEELPTTKAMLYRRVFRLMLTRWSALNLRALGRHLWLKELVMLELARRNVLHGQAEVITLEDLEQAMGTVAREYHRESDVPAAAALLDELTEQDGVLTRLGSGLFAFQHPTLQEYLAASLVAALPRDERMAQLTRKRLHARWEEVTQFCVSELDRLRHHEEADEVIRRLIRADAQQVSPYSWRDPLRLALVRAARCQGGRAMEHARTDLTMHLISAWWHIWWQGVTDPRLSYVVPSAEQAFRALGRLGDPIFQRLGLIVRGQPSNTYLYNFALRALSVAGPAAAPVAAELRKALHAPDRRARSAAALALGALGEAAEPALGDLCRMLDDPSITDDEGSVFRATVSPVNIDEETGRAIFQGKLNRSPGLENTPACAANALMQLGPVSAHAQDTLREILPTLNAYSRALVIRVLGSLWSDATASLDVFQAALRDEDPEVRCNAVSALGCLGPAAAPAAGHLLGVMRETLDDEKNLHGVHWAAIWAIRELGFGAAAILDDLREDLRHSSVETRRDALFLLEQMGPVKLPLLTDLCQALRDGDTEVRWSAARTIGSLGPHAAEARGDLILALDDPDAFVRVSACRALAALGGEALPAWDALARTVTGAAEQKVRGEAMLALGTLSGHGRGAEAIALFRQQLREAGEDLRTIIVQAIARAEQGNTSLRADLFHGLRDADPKVRAESVQAVGRISAPVTAAVTHLRRSLDQPADERMSDVVATLDDGMLRPLEHLRHAIRDPDPDVRSQAIEGLGNLTPTALSLLADMRLGGTAGGQPPAVLELAARLGTVTGVITDDLRRIARSPDDPQRVRAAASLRRCGADAALPALERLYPLLCDPEMNNPETNERRGASWARQTLGRNSPLGQAERNHFMPPYDEGVYETIAAVLAGTEDAGSGAGDGQDPSDVTQDRHRVPLTLSLFLDRGDTSLASIYRSNRGVSGRANMTCIPGADCETGGRRCRVRLISHMSRARGGHGERSRQRAGYATARPGPYAGRDPRRFAYAGDRRLPPGAGLGRRCGRDGLWSSRRHRDGFHAVRPGARPVGGHSCRRWDRFRCHARCGPGSRGCRSQLPARGRGG